MDLRNKTTEQLLLLAGVPVITDAHFVYTSGAHGPGYVNLRTLTTEGNEDILTEIAYRLVQAMLIECTPRKYQPIVFAGPDTLGSILAREGVTEYMRRHPGAYSLEWLHIQAHMVDDEKQFRLQTHDTHLVLTPTTQVFWIDDLLNRSSTFRKTRTLIEDSLPGIIKAVGVVMNRSEETETSLEVPRFVYLNDVTIPSYPKEDCPLCAQLLPIERGIGHGERFFQENPDYAGGFVQKH